MKHVMYHVTLSHKAKNIKAEGLLLTCSYHRPRAIDVTTAVGVLSALLYVALRGYAGGSEHNKPRLVILQVGGLETDYLNANPCAPGWFFYKKDVSPENLRLLTFWETQDIVGQEMFARLDAHLRIDTAGGL